MSSDRDKSSSRGKRLMASTALVILFLFLAFDSGRCGIATLLSAYASSRQQLAAANTAVMLNGRDPDNQYTRAAILETLNDLPRSLSSYEQAAKLRPDDYFNWLNVARLREMNHDLSGALVAARRATSLAPYYSQPHWLLGNLLIRGGKTREGFEELHLAAVNSPSVFPAIVDLAWLLSNDDAQIVQGIVHPASAKEYQSLAQYFIKKGRASDAVAILRSLTNLPHDEQQRYVAELIAEQQFANAYAIWSLGRELIQNTNERLTNPGFEERQNLNDVGFGWRSESKSTAVALDFDSANFNDGHSSLRIEFKGETTPDVAIVSQLVLVDKSSRYRLHFAVRSKGILSGSLPLLEVVDAADTKVLGSSVQTPSDTNNSWKDLEVTFDTRQSTSGVQVRLLRKSCGSSCPIFGELWLDSFSLQKIP